MLLVGLIERIVPREKPTGGRPSLFLLWVLEEFWGE